ncbi:MAG TPA: adenylate/guanylate cyclase domain-containing protein [Polyangiaceae bacterium]|nr:adenylate/guanylate cyclase domain-containing protein [Polyangiaceae bacterium]
MRISLKTKAIALFTAMSLGPVSLAVAALIDVNRQPIRDSEAQLQAAVIAEVTGTVARALYSFEADADAVAAVLAQAGRGDLNDESAIQAVRALIATRSGIEAVRFEVPSAGVSAVLQRASGSGAPDVPASTPELRTAADERGFGFARTGPTAGSLVVPIPTSPTSPTSKQGGGAEVRGYVTVRVSLAGLVEVLDRAAAVRFSGGQTSLLIADAKRVAIASHGVPNAGAGADTSALPIWSTLSQGVVWTTHFTVVDEHEQGGTTMVGTVESIPEFGWAVAVWRPEPVAFQALTAMRRRGLWVAGLAAFSALVVGFAVAHGVTRPIRRMVEAVRLIGARRWRDLKPSPPRGDEIGELTRSIDQMARDLQQGEEEVAREAKLRGDLSRFMSRDLVDAIVRGEHPLALGGRRTAVTVMFADVVAFTKLAEKDPAERVVALLNELFSMLSEIVFRHGGTVDKFIGDCIMAVWGAPVPAADHAARALAAAEDMMRFLETANEGWLSKYGVEVRLGIGVNSGEAIVGNIGSDKRMEYTVIGDIVNVAARLEAIAAPGEILVGEATQKLASEEGFELELLGERKLTGREAATRVYRLDAG